MAIENLEIIKIPDDADPEVIKVYEWLKRYKRSSARTKWLKRRDEAWDAMENEMYSDRERADMRKEGQEPLVINKINKGVQGSTAMVTDRKPSVNFYPIGEGDIYVAELFKRAFDFVWRKNEGNDITYDVAEESQVGGIGFFDVRFDADKGLFGKITIEEAPPDDNYWDAESRKRDMSDTHVIKAKLRTKAYVKTVYDGLTDEDLKYELIIQDESSESYGIEGGDNYAEDDLPPDSITQKDFEREKNVWEIEAWCRKIEDIEIKGIIKKVENIYKYVIVGKKLVDVEKNPFGHDSDGEPSVGLVSVRAQRTKSAYPMSPVAYALDINKDNNKRRAQFSFAISNNANAPIVESADSVKWTGNPGTPGSKAKVAQNAAFPPYRLQPGSLEAGQFLNLEQHGKEEIDDQFDMHDVMRGRIPPGQKQIAEKTVLALQDMGAVMKRPFLRNLESALVRVAKAVIVLCLTKWPQLMWLRLLEEDELSPTSLDENGRPTSEKWIRAIEKIRPSDQSAPPGFSLMDLDIAIEAGSSMPTNRMARGVMAIEYVKSGIYDAEAALYYIDDPQKEEVAKRMKAREEAAMQVAATKGK
jgi:hypothetical protein